MKLQKIHKRSQNNSQSWVPLNHREGVVVFFYQVFLLSPFVTHYRNYRQSCRGENFCLISSKNSASELLCTNVCVSVCTHQLYLSAPMHDLGVSVCPASIPYVLKLQFPASILS
jgi:hypothetical protein